MMSTSWVGRYDSNFLREEQQLHSFRILLMKTLFQISLQGFLLGEGTSVLLESLCSHAAAFPCQLRSVSLRYSPCKENKNFRKINSHLPLRFEITTSYGFLYSTEAPIELQEKTYISNSWINMMCCSGGSLGWYILNISHSNLRFSSHQILLLITALEVSHTVGKCLG